MALYVNGTKIVGGGGSSETIDVSSLITVHSGVTMSQGTITAYRTGNVVHAFFDGISVNEYSSDYKPLFDIDASIAPVNGDYGFALGINSSIKMYWLKADDRCIYANTGGWCRFAATWITS